VISLPAFYRPEDVLYLGVFMKNKLRKVWAFEQCLRQL
jgi:hypothetical protein